ncbi:methyltransferase family protein [Pseudobacteriovorax antillogorgiicola]|uniref:Protein-S-isoprenylcysteine O-methyltransferase Ste14 n=1 Tax=Pseudobacteriovorax antillogorgiicola TaxID=1513793 RepID=A0A1Y6BJF8_9BACT|nr:isoprenylcysteine carboxylmethyltransferase family protein [Pseudobacteriovorax antillogorgiicola]TCS55557.1 protein-S-isoprenylcysteine O-methyltransferase Ste14 [Pseudobacteriovorax antillogorgiicola]SMF11004.1 Protein-S-isoprenylcysteine O-methyltransferase Ste14 [Pseudobacteriovorax antillogorgiicola]
MEHQYTIGSIYLILAMISIYSYDKKKLSPEKDQRAKQNKSVTSFKYFYRFSQLVCLSTIAMFFMASPTPLQGTWSQEPTFLYLGAAFSILGVLIFVGAKMELGNDNYSHCSNMFLPKDIIRTGLYKYIRHPIYTANLVMILGLFISSGNYLVLATWLVMGLYYNHSARIEEQCLEHAFTEYKDYKKSTGRFLPWRELA